MDDPNKLFAALCIQSTALCNASRSRIIKTWRFSSRANSNKENWQKEFQAFFHLDDTLEGKVKERKLKLLSLWLLQLSTQNNDLSVDFSF